MSGGRWHVVVPGDCLASIAARDGVAHERDILNHPENAALRAARPSMYILAPGDRVFVPQPELARALRVQPGSTNRFSGRPRRRFVRVVLQRGAEVLSGVRYELEAAGERFEGTTAGDGVVAHEIRVDAREATLTLHEGSRPPRSLRLAIGKLDPHDTPSGQRQRLRNLGFGGDRAAVEAFQRAAGLESTGELGAETATALKQRYEG